MGDDWDYGDRDYGDRDYGDRDHGDRDYGDRDHGGHGGHGHGDRDRGGHDHGHRGGGAEGGTAVPDRNPEAGVADADVDPSSPAREPLDRQGTSGGGGRTPTTSELAVLLASAMASGIVGNAAYDAVKAAVRYVQALPPSDQQRTIQPYVEKIAQLQVALTVERRRGRRRRAGATSYKVLGFTHSATWWFIVVDADGEKFNVSIPRQDGSWPMTVKSINADRGSWWTRLLHRRR